MGWGKDCSGCLGQMMKMATTPIYGKNSLKIFFSGPKGPMTLVLVLQHRGLGPNKVFSNDDLDLFYGKVKFASLCFYIVKYTFLQEKCEKVIYWK